MKANKINPSQTMHALKKIIKFQKQEKENQNSNETLEDPPKE